MPDSTSPPSTARHPTTTARAQLELVFADLTDEQAERALTVLEASAEWILTGASTPLTSTRSPSTTAG